MKNQPFKESSMQATFDSTAHAFIDMSSAFTGTRALSQSVMQPFNPIPFEPGFGGNFMPSQEIDATSYSQQYSQTPHGISEQMSASNFHQSSGPFGFEQSFSYDSFRYQQDAPTCGGQNNNWSNTEVKDGKSSIDLGDYKLDLNKKDSSINMTNKQTAETTRIWGDPHIDTNGTSGMFKGPMSFNLPNGTKVTVGTQSQGNVSYADNVTITRGNDAYVVHGLSEKDSNPLTVQHQHNGRQLDAETPDGYSLVSNGKGKGWIDPQTGRAPTAGDFSKH
ncbi:DUF1521 domain-containing protein [Paraburkholderia sp. CNPSo 3157]|uniref:DUF1521 domain-containing protein n=1 Tax=Paraburkholderia franconis TaxID=2654983 RepID=A0A7X1TEV9_9BURK|nr:DUF1521 domain-containing protein [Paraburkholderia franconis]MPW16740.1 DUF1521 domain-containing protein [Paraburkholderia franconis]